MPRLKHLLRLQYGSALAADTREEGEFNVYGSNGAVGTHVARNTKAPAIIVGRKGSFGKVTWANSGGFCIDTAYFVDNRYCFGDLRFSYYALLHLKLDEHSKDSAVPGLDRNDAHNSRLDLPDRPTQRAIADFLDRETARIDLLIEKKQRLVALLGEKLQAAISTLVKKGTSNPSIRLRHVARLNPSARGLRLEPDALVTFCPMEAIRDGVGGIDTSNTRPISEVASASYNFFAEGDILLAKVTPCFENGKKALARDLMNGVGFATSEVFVVRVDPEKISPEYLVYLFSSDDFQYAGRSSMTGAGGLRRISERSILDFPLFVTDRLKQQVIAEKIDSEVEKSRKITAKTNASIDRLKEYRSALITAAVTGQIDVSTYARSGTADRDLDTIQEEVGA